jgi:hypothetical protein
MISLEMLHQAQDVSQFTQSDLPLGALLEGEFVSLFLNRVPPELSGAPEIGFTSKSKPTRMIVFADGDLPKSQIQPSDNGPIPLPAGYDRFTRQQFGNRDLILNAVNYLSRRFRDALCKVARAQAEDARRHTHQDRRTQMAADQYRRPGSARDHYRTALFRLQETPVHPNSQIVHLSMKKNRILLLITLALILIAVILLMSRRTGTLNARVAEFAVNDTASITKIFFADKQNNTVKLERIGGGTWKLNENYTANTDAVNVMLKTLMSIDVKAPVAKAARNNIIRLMAAKSVKVEVYQRVFRINLSDRIRLFPHEKKPRPTMSATQLRITWAHTC